MSELRYGLKTPCNDCPFGLDSSQHEGIAGDAAAVIQNLLDGEMAHSCHKTDPRADCAPEERVSGPVQHCAGALIMAVRSGYWQDHMLVAGVKKKFNDKRLSKTARVHTPKSFLAFQLRFMLEQWGKFIGPRTEERDIEMQQARLLLEVMS